MAVFMLAIVFAFATQNKTSFEEDASLIGFVYSDAEKHCVIANKDCSPNFGIPCQQADGKYIYRFPSSTGTMCSVALYEWPDE